MASTFSVDANIKKIGWIPFWNLKPLYHELKLELGSDYGFVEGSPTEINRLMNNGSIQLGPCSSVCLALNPKQDLALPLGVVCDGKVLSVYLGMKSQNKAVMKLISERHEFICKLLKSISNNNLFDIRNVAAKFLQETSDFEIPISELPSIRLSKSSASSVMLTRVLYRLWFGEKLYAKACRLGKISETPIKSDAPTMELVIGDEALSVRRAYYHILDLGGLWKDLTQLPFVYAAWQTNMRLGAELKNKIMDIAERTEAKMKIEPQRYIPSMPPLDDFGKPIGLEEYWQKIYYRLGKSEMSSLTLFLALSKILHPIENSDQITVRIMHFQEIVNSHRVN